MKVLTNVFVGKGTQMTNIQEVEFLGGPLDGLVEMFDLQVDTGTVLERNGEHYTLQSRKLAYFYKKKGHPIIVAIHSSRLG